MVGSATYDAYGNVTASSGGTYNPFGYAGEYTDAESGFLYLRARYYDPATQQFLTVDPVLAATEQAYNYAGGDPVNATDPAGLMDGLPGDRGEGGVPVGSGLGGVGEGSGSGGGVGSGGGGGGAGEGVMFGTPEMAAAQEEFEARLATEEEVCSGVPQGLTEEQFNGLSAEVRADLRATSYGDDIRVHGSRAKGTAAVDADIDIAIRVSPEEFDRYIEERFGTPNPGSAKEDSMLRLIEDGRISGGKPDFVVFDALLKLSWA